MTPEKWEKIKDLFLAAEKMSPEKRVGFLDKECDLELRQEVEKLLDADRDDDSFLEDAAVAEVPSLFDEKTQIKEAEQTQAQIHTTNSDSVRFAEGSVLADRYRILGLLGKGGMGEVYKARDIKLDQNVALKFLPENLKQNEDALRRFVGEVKTARHVSHENVCKVFDIGEVDGKSYLSMEFIEGDDLSQLLNRIGRLPSDKAIEISRQICMGLNAIHKTGILHRDLKPANIIIDSNGKARITDFGIAGFEEDVQGAESRVGTPAYMSPEQLTGKEVTQKSDIYSLGLLIYEIFTGKQAFEGESLSQLADIHGTTDPTDPSELVEHLDPTVETVINRCLEKNPSDRPQSALHVAMALPGGNPLQVALEAGETPTPEMVAAAPKKGVLRLPVAFTLLAAFVALFALSIYLNSEYAETTFTPLEKSPEILKERAKRILNNLGHTYASNDNAFGFRRTEAYKNYLYKTNNLPDSWDRLKSGQPFLIYFYYRQSHKKFEPFAFPYVNESNPPLTEPETAYIKLDTRGRLVELIAVPPQISLQKPIAETNWKGLFEEAGLDFEKFEKAESKLTPPIFADERTAWQGTSADFEDIPIRIEAAAYQGKPVYFRVVPPWDDDLMEQGVYMENISRSGITIAYIFLYFLAIFGAIVLSYFNLKAGRGDIKGAVKISAFYFFTVFTASLVFNDRVPALNQGIGLFFVFGGAALSLFLVYVGIEPFVRRWWSEMLISWNRLLAGDFTDPLIGRDILVGGLLGLIFSLTITLGGFLRDFLVSKNLTVDISSLSSLDGIREFAEVIVELPALAVYTGLLYLILFVIFYLIFRRKWITILLVSLVVVAADGLGWIPTRGWTYILLLLVVYTPIVYLFARFGLVTVITSIFFVRLVYTAITLDISRFYFSNTIIVAIIGLAIAFYAFYISIGDQKIFEGKILKDIKD